MQDSDFGRSFGTPSPFLDSILGAAELETLCSHLGFRPPIWHKTETFVNGIESSVDETTIERDWNGGDGIARVIDVAALRTVIDEAENCFQGWAERAQNRHDPTAWEEGFKAGETSETKCPYPAGTAQSWSWSRGRVEGNSKRQGFSYSRGALPTQEFDGVIRLLRDVRQLLAEQKPVPASMISDLTTGMWCGRNWERLPERLYGRKRALDKVLMDVCFASVRPTTWGLDMRARHLASAAQEYAANKWMHTRWLTTLVAREMLSDLKSSLQKREKRLRGWCFALLGLGSVLVYFSNTRFLGIVLVCIVNLVLVVSAFWMIPGQSALDRIIDEVQSGFYSGRVLAERLERLNGFRCDVPSILTEMLRVQHT